MSRREDQRALEEFIENTILKIKASFVRVLVGLLAGIAGAPLAEYCSIPASYSCILPAALIPVAYYATIPLLRRLYGYRLSRRDVVLVGLPSFLASWLLGLLLGEALM